MSTLATLATVRRSWDADAGAYIKAVESADQQQLEPMVAQAINQFVLGCKADGIWSALKASCILMGARTLSGALTPLVGTAPTNSNFVSGDYNRKTGLKGNGSTKFLNSNRNNNADPENSKHCSFFYSDIGTTSAVQHIATSQTTGNTMLRSNAANLTDGVLAVNSSSTHIVSGVFVQNQAGFAGISRATSSAFSVRTSAGTTVSVSSNSVTPLNENILLFKRGSNAFYSNIRLAFYSIGESVDLALLDARVSALYTAIGAAIA